MDASVVVVGAGPAGLMLAGELRLAGVDVVVIEKLTESSGQSRGIGFTVRTAELFDQRGLLPRFGELVTSQMIHFGGVPISLSGLVEEGGAVRSVPQSATEAVLEDWARRLGADIRRGVEFTGLSTEDDRVTVHVAGDRKPLRARYLVGCDGGRSEVRKAAGFDFPGTSATTELFLADVRGVELEQRILGQQVDGGMVMVGHLPGGVSRIIVGERGAPPQQRSGPPRFAEVADVWKRLTGIDISHAEPLWVSAFGDAARQVTEYRRGRVFLAGDAAHVHMPTGGQGMNTSIQDSVNLGWKLAAVLRGTAPESLVDTYHSERHEVGRRLLVNTRAQTMLILGGDEVAPLREVLSELVRYPDVERHLAAEVSGLGIRYDVGGGRNPLLGARMPSLSLSRDGRRTTSAELLRTGRGVLLDLADNATLRRRAAAWTDRVDVITATPVDEPPEGTSAVLVRPDGYVAWAAPGSDLDLPSALGRWFGPPRASSR